MIDLFGVTIHDPDVVFTDVGLAVLGWYLAWRLRAASGAVFMAALASAALWGAVFHGFFPRGTATRPGFVLWMAVVMSIVVAAASLVGLSLRVLAPKLPSAVQRSVVAAYAAAFVIVVLLIDHTFDTVVLFYGSALVLFLVVALIRAVGTRDRGWTLMAGGLTLSAAASLLQQLKVTLHPVWFDHNALYHVVQGGALVLIYVGFRRAPGLVDPEAPESRGW